MVLLLIVNIDRRAQRSGIDESRAELRDDQFETWRGAAYLWYVAAFAWVSGGLMAVVLAIWRLSVFNATAVAVSATRFRCYFASVAAIVAFQCGILFVISTESLEKLSTALNICYAVLICLGVAVVICLADSNNSLLSRGH